MKVVHLANCTYAHLQYNLPGINPEEIILDLVKSFCFLNILISIISLLLLLMAKEKYCNFLIMESV